MFFVKRFGKITLGVLIFIAITVEWRAFSLRAGRLPRNVINVATNLSVTTGDPARMVYKATSDVLAMNAEMFGQWTKNNSTILQTDNIVIGGNREKKRFWLRIKSVHMYDAGLYSFKINGTVVGQWKLQVQDILDQEPPCGEPLPDVASVCVPFNKGTHPKCLSFPGAPLNMQVSTDIYKGRLVINVTWKKPNNGLSDLWGYQVHIAGRDYHPGYSDCGQVNSKDKLNWFFEHVRYGATYQIMVQSMPAHHTTSEESNLSKMVFKVQEKCQFPEYIHTSECCTMNITTEYKSKQIHLKWVMPPREECQEIQTFAIQWNNIQKPEECNGEALVMSKYEYFIPLKEDNCNRFNYSIKLSGKTNKTETKVFKFTVLIPPKAPNPRTAEPTPDNFKKILIAVFGSFLGLLICTILVMYRIFFQQVKIQLPVSPPPRPHFHDPLLESCPDKKRVFIMHTRCCEKCSYAVHCFGAVLNSTDLIEASIDMWSTLDIAPNVPRWYEDQVKNSHCVVVLASNKMSLRCQNAVEEGDDPLNIKCQLNLVRGNIAQNPDVRRFIPAFFTCSGSKKNIPEFLTSRWSHKLPKDIDRVIFHLLNVEKIQPYRTQPIIVMGGNGHPFDERKKEFERAVQEAELYHKKNNNLQNGNAYLIT